MQQALKKKSGITSTPQVFFGAKFNGDDGKIQALAKVGTLVEAVQDKDFRATVYIFKLFAFLLLVKRSNHAYEGC